MSISLLKDSAEFTDEELSKFKDFHEFVFANVLRLEKDPMDFSPDHADVGYLIVPLLRGKCKGLTHKGYISFVKFLQNTMMPQFITTIFLSILTLQKGLVIN